MIKQTIKFKNLEGKEVERDFYFHIKKDQLIKLEIAHDGQFKEWLVNLIGSGKGRLIMDAFEDIVKMAYGEKTDDGLSFLQSRERSEWFMGTDAYTEFFMRLVTEADFAANFVNGIMPSDLDQAAARLEAAEIKATVPDDVTGAAKPAISDEDLANVLEAIRSGKVDASALVTKQG